MMAKVSAVLEDVVVDSLTPSAALCGLGDVSVTGEVLWLPLMSFLRIWLSRNDCLRMPMLGRHAC